MIIYKYEIPIKDEFVIDLPDHSRILTFQMQNDRPFIWCLVNPYRQIIEQKFKLYGTGQQIFDVNNLDYIGTVQWLEHLCGNTFIWHLFADHSISHPT